MMDVLVAGAGARCGSSDHGGDNSVEPGELMLRDWREGHTTCVHCAFGVTSTGLVGLAEVLTAAHQAAVDALDDRFDHGQVDDGIDWTNLPTFGGTEPADTCGIWSWDATHLLVGSCLDDLDIEEREAAHG